MVYFEMPEYLFASDHKSQIILLDTTGDQYLSLSDAASVCYRFFLKNKFEFNDSKYTAVNPLDNLSDELINYYFKYFFENKLIRTTFNLKRKNYLAAARYDDGLNQIEWELFKNKSLDKPVKFKDLIDAILTLAKVHRILKNQGLKALLDYIQNSAKKNKYIHLKPSENAIKYLAFVLDKACLIYPGKTLCLPWAAALNLLASKKKWSTDFIIGIQSRPFYAHAWVEYEEKVINDNPQLKDKLSPILRIIC